MPVISRLVSICLRIGELAFAVVVAGLIGSYLHSHDSGHSWPGGRFIYTEVVAAISILLALFWLLPFAGGFIHWPADVILSLAWFAVFGLLVNYIHGTDCKASVFDWAGITHGGVCNRWQASEAFSFLSAIFWIVSAVVGLWFVHRTHKNRAVDSGVG
jgi:Membrane-associating domain